MFLNRFLYSSDLIKADILKVLIKKYIVNQDDNVLFDNYLLHDAMQSILILIHKKKLHLENSVLISLAQTFNENFSGFENILDLYTVPKSGEAKTPLMYLTRWIENQTLIIFDHEMNLYPNVLIIDETKFKHEASISYPTLNQVRVSFSKPFTGFIILSGAN